MYICPEAGCISLLLNLLLQGSDLGNRVMWKQIVMSLDSESESCRQGKVDLSDKHENVFKPPTNPRDTHTGVFTHFAWLDLFSAPAAAETRVLLANQKPEIRFYRWATCKQRSNPPKQNITATFCNHKLKTPFLCPHVNSANTVSEYL